MSRLNKETWIEIRKWIVTIIEILLIVAAIYGAITLINSVSLADGGAKAYIICRPGDYVNAREKPDRHSEQAGFFEAGDEVILDGKTSNGFAHLAYPTFEGDSWVYTGYIVFDKPVWKGGQTAIVNSNANLAVRKCITGEIKKWLKNGQEMQVFWWSEEWCVTNYGFVMTEWIELVGEAI